MENGVHTNGDLKGLDMQPETPKAASFPALSPPAGRPTSNSTGAGELASLLPPDIVDGSDSGSQRSSLQPRVPSRQLLQTALDLAQKAVEMDKGNDVAGALAAYRDAVGKLRIVMERVGVDPTGSNKNEDEGRTLRGIHDAYMARITLLSAYETSESDDAPSLGNLTLDSAVDITLQTGPADSPTNDAGPSTPLLSPATSSLRARRRQKQSKHSFGLDEEADLEGLDGVNREDDGSTQSRSLAQVDGSPRQSMESDRPLPPLPSVEVMRQPTHERQPSSPRQALSPQALSQPLNLHQRSGTITSLDVTEPSRDLEPFPLPPLQASVRSTLAPPLRLQGTAHLSQPLQAVPDHALHRSFNLIRALSASMDTSGTGAYITDSIHIDPSVWKPRNAMSRGAKIAGLEAKSRVCEALLSHLQTLKTTGTMLLEGQREERFGEGSTQLSKAQIDKVIRVGDEFSSVLDGLDDELDISYKTLQSKGVVAGQWKGKNKSSWGSRISARVDKMSRGSDSPDRYIDVLAQLFFAIQTIDDHLRCFTGPCTPAYHALPHKTYKQIETRVTRAAQFVGAVVVPFVLDDLRQFMLGYLKGGAKYLDE